MEDEVMTDEVMEVTRPQPMLPKAPPQELPQEPTDEEGYAVDAAGTFDGRSAQ